MRLLNITKQVDNFLNKLPGKQFKQVYTTIMELRKNIMPHDSKKLNGFLDLYRVEVGEYRIIYKFDNEVVYIQAVGKRNDDEIYKIIKR